MKKEFLRLEGSILYSVRIDTTDTPKVTFDRCTVDNSQCYREIKDYVTIDSLSDGLAEFFLCHLSDGSTDLISSKGVICQIPKGHIFRPGRAHSEPVADIISLDKRSNLSSFRQYDLTGHLTLAKEICRTETQERTIFIDFTKKEVTSSFEIFISEEDDDYEPKSGKFHQVFDNLEYKKLEGVELVYATTTNKIKVYSLTGVRTVCSCVQVLQEQKVLGQLYLKVLSIDGRKEIYDMSGYRITYTRPDSDEVDTNMVFTGCDTGFTLSYDDGKVETYNMEGQLIDVK